jgi:pre-mRNA-splicing factor SYF1
MSVVSYNEAIELKVATPMNILNFASFLKDQTYFEEPFTAYERGVELFPFPHAGAKLLWTNYLHQNLNAV